MQNGRINFQEILTSPKKPRGSQRYRSIIIVLAIHCIIKNSDQHNCKELRVVRIVDGMPRSSNRYRGIPRYEIIGATQP